ncbi:MAG TPA: nucleotide exchange factor GrpE [Geminicoccaceae bacterium]|nr:nucleotide exchange factor GrpE [Geminicoccaceae bacterium]
MTTSEHNDDKHRENTAGEARQRRGNGAGGTTGPAEERDDARFEAANDPGAATAAEQEEVAAAEEEGTAAATAATDEEPWSPDAALEAEVAELKDRLLRTLAEMENLRRRTARDIDEARKYAVTGFARDLLEVADNLGRALQSIPERAKEEAEFVRNLADGVAMTERALLNTFERHRIAKVEPRPGDRFDHNRHQAMFEVETDDQPPGTVAQVLQAGYVIGDRLLRPAMVGVAKAGAGREQRSDGTSDRPDDGEGRPGERLDTSA